MDISKLTEKEKNIILNTLLVERREQEIAEQEKLEAEEEANLKAAVSYLKKNPFKIDPVDFSVDFAIVPKISFGYCIYVASSLVFRRSSHDIEDYFYEIDFDCDIYSQIKVDTDELGELELAEFTKFYNKVKDLPCYDVRVTCKIQYLNDEAKVSNIEVVGAPSGFKNKIKAYTKETLSSLCDEGVELFFGDYYQAKRLYCEDVADQFDCDYYNLVDLV